MIETTTCLACGHRARALSPNGDFVAFNDRQADQLIAFLNHEFDVRKCEACGERLNIAPTLIVGRSTQPNWLVVAGPRMVGREGELIENLATQDDVQVQVLASIDELRSALERDIKARLSSLARVLEARNSGQLAEYVVEHWRELDGAVFAALVVALTIQIPGVGFSIAWSSKDGAALPTRDDFMRSLGSVQADCWIALARSWMRSTTHSGSLETDLTRYVDDAPVLPGSVERLLEACAHLRSVSQDTGLHYMLSALQASACRTAGVDNPDRTTWTAVYFALELAAIERGDDFSQHWRAMLISAERAAATVPYEDSWNVVGALADDLLTTNPPDRTLQMERIDTVASKAGHTDLTTDVLTKGRVIDAESGDMPFETFERMARFMAERTHDPSIFFPALRNLAALLVRHNRLMDVVRLADLAIELLGGTHENQARADTWLGRYLKEYRQPNLFFARAGDTPRDWEHELPLHVRAPLWTERANALRLAGRQAEALVIHQQLDVDLAANGDDEQRNINRLNRGILERETGALDASVATLRGLLPDLPAVGDDRISALASLAATYVVLRDFESALSVYDQAIPLATGPYSARASELSINRDIVLRAIKQATEATPPSWDNLNPRTDGNHILGVAGAWILAIGRNGATLAKDRADQLVALLAQTSTEAVARRDAHLAVQALVAAGELLHGLDRDEDGFAQFIEALRLCDELDIPADEIALVRVARGSYLMGTPEQARVFLQQLPHTLAAMVGRVSDLSLATESVAALSSALQEVADAVLFVREAKAGWADVRLVAELSRDAVSRARVQHRLGRETAGASVLSDGLDDAVVARLAPATGAVCVLEWIESSRHLGGFLTTIDAERALESSWLAVPEEIDLRSLARQIRRRLAVWLPDDEGDPFDLPDWQVLERDVRQQIEAVAGPDTHIVIIEHEAYAGLPWHVALRPWSCSYTSGWNRLLREADADRTPITSIGVALVPRIRESAAVVEALDTSLKRAERIAAKTGLELTVRAGDSCDRAAFTALLEHVDAMKLLCHGFVGRDGSVSLMLAHDGQLPLANSVAAASATGTPHRVSWRDMQTLTSAPRVVFSAACSSGTSAIAGLGERLGLHSALADAGTSAIVAPWWDIVASQVIPVLDDICDAHLEGIPLGEAVHAACRRAATTRPTWLAWALALEGDWR